jgi:hypothetical protein
MTIQSLPASTNFQLSYEDSIPNADKRAQAVEGVCENEFSVLKGWFGIPPGAFGASDRIQVYLEQRRDPDTAAYNHGYQSGGKSNIHIDAQSAINNAANAAEIVKMLFVMELVEVFMSYNNQHGANKNSWNASNSDGEALSHLCGIERFRTGHYLVYPGQNLFFPDRATVDRWLQNTGRPDWVSTPENTDGNPVSIGCGLLFLYYLKSQLNHPVPKIIQNGGASLEELYKNLTGQSNAFDAFNGLVSQYFPAGNTPLFTTFDDPFPLLDPVSRRVSVSVSQATIAEEGSTIWSDTVNVQPFPSKSCAAMDYYFQIDSTPETVDCVATVRGFGQPLFAWRVNGVDVPAGGGPIEILASMLVDDTTNPQEHATVHKNITVSCFEIPTLWKGDLTIDVPPEVVGHVDLVIDALVSDRFVASAVQTNGTGWVTADNEKVFWDSQYYRDREVCRAEFEEFLKRSVIVEHVPPWLWGIFFPDPMPSEYGRVIRQLSLINELLKETHGGSHELVRMAETMMRRVYGLTPELLGQITNQQKRGAG